MARAVSYDFGSVSPPPSMNVCMRYQLHALCIKRNGDKEPPMCREHAGENCNRSSCYTANHYQTYVYILSFNRLSLIYTIYTRLLRVRYTERISGFGKFKV